MAERVVPMVYQFKVTLKHSKPPIWRRIQVPEDYSFYDLHVAIQSTMEWKDYHLHQFHIRNPRTGENEYISFRDEVSFDMVILGGKTRRVADYFPAPKSKAVYEYDFGDGWEHTVELEKVLPAQPGVQYPQCIAGKNAGPPEDCGGIGGYDELKQVIADPGHPEHEERMEWLRGMDWLGGDFNPAKFDPKSVVFSDPEERWRLVSRDFENSA